MTLCKYQAPYYLLTLSNPVMQGIKMKLSSPRFLIPSDSSDIGLEFPDCLKRHMQSESSVVSSKTMMDNFKSLLFAFPQVKWLKALVSFCLY